MDIWACDKCGCEVPKIKPTNCPLCNGDEFAHYERDNPSKDDDEFSKKYEEIIEQLDKYTEDCEPEDLRFSAED